ncbi:MAG TPA: M3 family oligoendopeptidase, partial [Candidatus Methylomirabilis sp.]|nr:M3 family oligoendopeptidase [Candidatus Methylomirabilis sp.]
MAGQGSSAAGITWDLTDLFASHDDPRIEATLEECRRRADAFAARYRGTIHWAGSPSAEALLAGLQELEAIQESLGRVGAYAGLLYASDTSRLEYQNLQQRVEEQGTDLANRLLFFELEWLSLEEGAAESLLREAALAPYRHYLETLRRFRPHKLSEAEEKIVIEKDNAGRRAFGRLFAELTSGLTFPVEQDGQVRDLTLSETLACLYQPDRALRRRAFEALFEVLARHGLVLTVTYDALVQDHLLMDRLRRYPHPMAERHLTNEIDHEAVERMLEVAEANYGIAHDYFALKARLLDLPRLALYDQYAPVGGPLPPCTFDRAKEVILEAFAAFHPGFREVAEQFFARRWIDAEIRKGKHGGAFCSSPSPALHPYILCNYTDNLRDVMTVAHELGHGLHGWLARKQSYFNYDTPLTTAETASVFGEFLVFDHLLRTEADPAVRLALLSGKIEDTFATVFRQTVLTRFEQEAFAWRKGSRFTADGLGQAWLTANRRYYGDAVEIPQGYRWGWSYIPHFIHTRFYCYAYVFGELLVLALYRMYR